MLQIPLKPVPQQSLNVVLAQQNVILSLYTLADLYGPAIYADLANGTTPVKSCIRCVNLARWLPGLGYLGFIGDFIMVDTQGDTQPVYTGLGSRYQLIYLEASDLV